MDRIWQLVVGYSGTAHEVRDMEISDHEPMADAILYIIYRGDLVRLP